jgi:parallel beta-helix repeat protein
MRAIRLRRMSSATLGVSVVALLCAGPARALTQIGSCGTTISSPGDYQVADDLSCAGDGITITSSGVRLNMAHHVLSGNGTGTGLSVVGVPGDVDVGNGTLTGFSTGVRIQGARGVNLEAVTATGNATGMVLDHADGNDITDTLVMNNTGDGIQAFRSNHNVITASVSNGNGGAGLLGQDFDDNVLSGNGFHGDGGDGVRLDRASDGNLFRANDVADNGANGLSLVRAHGNTLKANIVRRNGGTGIRVQAGSTQNLAQGNTAQQNSVLDVADLNPDPCTDNTWKSNNFATDSEGDGNQAGCIR